MSQFRLQKKSCNVDHIYQTRNKFCFTSHNEFGSLECHSPTRSAKTSVVTIE